MIRRCVAELKAIPGWRTKNKYVAIAVDDYGNVRLRDHKARSYLKSRIAGFGGQMDMFDSVETRVDMEALFDVLSGVTDVEGRNAIITAYTLTANPDFSVLREERRYAYEPLTHTFERLTAEQPKSYEGTWSLWKEGIKARLIQPQFHGREHLNIPVLEYKLQRCDSDIEANLKVESMAGLKSVASMPGVKFTQAFSFHDASVLEEQGRVITDGLSLFKSIFGFSSKTFAPPGLKLHKKHDSFVRKLGISSIDKPFFGYQPVGAGKRQASLNFLTAPRQNRVGKIVRTLSFEPCSGLKTDPVGQALKEIEIAFRWNKPAIISSHRVNFVGHIDSDNRKKGLKMLKALLKSIKRKWPEVRFIGIDELVQEMALSKNPQLSEKCNS